MQLVQLQYRLDDSILSQRTLHLRLGESDVKAAMDKATARIRRKVEVPGFRKGKAPMSTVRNHHAARVRGIAFDELKRAAIDQAVKQLEAKDRPFLPVDVVEPEQVKLTYGKALEFAVRYLVDPSGMSARPEQPSQHFNPLAQLHSRVQTAGTMGVPGAPQLPAIPQIPGAPQAPSLPALATPPTPQGPKRS